MAAGGMIHIGTAGWQYEHWRGTFYPEKISKDRKNVEWRKRTMSKIAVIIGDMFEDVEYTEPAKAFKAKGHSLVHVGLEKGQTVEGKKEGTKVKIDKAVKDVSVNDFDALLIPGGYSPDKLRAYEEPVKFVKDFLQSGKPVFAICHAAQLLITADVLKGRKLTGWKSIVQDIKNAGAQFIDDKVVEDKNLVSSRQPSDLPEFIAASLAKLKG
jgi:protease I